MTPLRRQPPIRWILFDAVHTLLTPHPAAADVYHAVGCRHGSTLDRETVQRRFRRAFRESETACFSVERLGQTSEREERARWRWVVEQVFPDLPGDGCFAELWEHFARPENWRCFDDAGPTLRQLSAQGYQLALASNFDERLTAVRTDLPELAVIERQFVSSTLGYRKPDRRFYETIASALEARPGELLMIGDDQRCDVEGPRACGWQALRLDRRKGTEEDVLGSLEELLVLLSK